MTRIAILGATGYSGGELIRILSHTPGVRLQHLTSESSFGRTVSSVHPHYRQSLNLKFEKYNFKKIVKDSNVVFSCYPPGVGLVSTSKLVKAGVKVIDLSADYRLPTSKLYKSWYKKNHSSPHLLKSRVYGLPEIYRDKIKKASLVANPGCYATASILAAYPLLSSRLIDPKTLIVDAKSGVSGAGKKVALSHIYTEVNENLSVYGVASHRHQPEIESILSDCGPSSVQLTFTPHLIPMNRGLIAVLYATCKKSMKIGDLRSVYLKAYENEPFVRILPEGSVPMTKNVVNTNNCDIGIFQDARLRRVIIVSAIDNLVKGAAGQAVQNMNLLINRSETEGLL